MRMSRVMAQEFGIVAYREGVPLSDHLCGYLAGVFTRNRSGATDSLRADLSELLDFVDRFCCSATEFTPKELHEEAQALLRKHGRSRT